MDNQRTPFPASNIIAASILGASLIASALIVAQRPAGSQENTPSVTTSAKPSSAPPIAQESAIKQFRAQVMAAPTMQTFRHNGAKYTLSDVRVKQVVYYAKTDEFLIRHEWVWQPKNPFADPHRGHTVLTNDGYGHYYGSVDLSPSSGGIGQKADVTIRSE